MNRRRLFLVLQVIVDFGYGIALGVALSLAIFVYSLDWLLRAGV